MRYITSFLVLVFLTSCAQESVNTKGEVDEKAIYKNWMLSRCLGVAFPGESTNQDALNSASAYLEQSRLPLEAFVAAEPLIQSFIENRSQGSILGDFKVKSCIDLYHSSELESLFIHALKNYNVNN